MSINLANRTESIPINLKPEIEIYHRFALFRKGVGRASLKVGYAMPTK